MIDTNDRKLSISHCEVIVGINRALSFIEE